MMFPVLITLVVYAIAQKVGNGGDYGGESSLFRNQIGAVDGVSGLI